MLMKVSCGCDGIKKAGGSRQLLQNFGTSEPQRSEVGSLRTESSKSIRKLENWGMS